METAEHILQNESNITKVENTYLRHKLSSEAEDETIIDDIKTPTLIQFNYSSAYKGKTYYNNTIYDAQGMTINFDMLYLVPSTEVKKGDIIDKDGKAYYVLETNNGVVKCINLEDGKEENLVPGGPFGMTMYSKLFNPMGQMQGENSFGNILMMQALCGNDGYGSGDNSMLLAMMMMQGGFKFPTFQMPAVAPTTTSTENKN